MLCLAIPTLDWFLTKQATGIEWMPSNISRYRVRPCQTTRCQRNWSCSLKGFDNASLQQQDMNNSVSEQKCCFATVPWSAHTAIPIRSPLICITFILVVIVCNENEEATTIILCNADVPKKMLPGSEVLWWVHSFSSLSFSAKLREVERVLQ